VDYKNEAAWNDRQLFEVVILNNQSVLKLEKAVTMTALA
jgi:hypothetical protein